MDAKTKSILPTPLKRTELWIGRQLIDMHDVGRTITDKDWPNYLIEEFRLDGHLIRLPFGMTDSIQNMLSHRGGSSGHGTAYINKMLIVVDIHQPISYGIADIVIACSYDDTYSYVGRLVPKTK